MDTRCQSKPTFAYESLVLLECSIPAALAASYARRTSGEICRNSGALPDKFLHHNPAYCIALHFLKNATHLFLQEIIGSELILLKAQLEALVLQLLDPFFRVDRHNQVLSAVVSMQPTARLPIPPDRGRGPIILPSAGFLEIAVIVVLLGFSMRWSYHFQNTDEIATGLIKKSPSAILFLHHQGHIRHVVKNHCYLYDHHDTGSLCFNVCGLLSPSARVMLSRHC